MEEKNKNELNAGVFHFTPKSSSLNWRDNWQSNRGQKVRKIRFI